jgi:uncharacterized protein (DUF302 family)
MTSRIAYLCTAALVAAALAVSPAPATRAVDAAAAVGADGLIRVRSAYGMDETIARLKAAIAGKGIRFFEEVDQAQLAAEAGIELHPSTLLVFGNPALGAQFVASDPDAGIDWPVRLLVYRDAAGGVWAVYTDFGYIAERHGVVDRAAQFATATGVVASITAAVAAE